MAQIGAVAALATIIASPAMAITCHGRYQVVNGDEISTPYCEDNFLARIARSRGIGVSNREIRGNPNTKYHVCRTIGQDIRLSGICNDYGGDSTRTR